MDPFEAEKKLRVSLSDFFSYLPSGQYLFVPTGDFWPARSVNSQIPPQGEKKATTVLDEARQLHQVFWHPAEPQLVEDRLALDGGWLNSEGTRVLNMYRPPKSLHGDPDQADAWVDHIRHVYPDDADHIINYLAFKVQNPGVKINHALVLGGSQGVGKDTILEPVRTALGEWNVQDVSPTMITQRFNPWIKCVLLVISEARDLGEMDRFAFYEHMKTYTASPPEVLTCDQKHMQEQRVFNVMGVVVTTNHKTGGIYLPTDDRRHYFAWSNRTKEEFSDEYWQHIYRWYENGGRAHVAAHLRSLDLSGFNPKAPPEKTQAWHAAVGADVAPEEMDLLDSLEALLDPAVVTLADIKQAATDKGLYGLVDLLGDRRAARSIPHKLERAGYTQVRNTATKDGRWKISGSNTAVYGHKSLSFSEQARCVRMLPELTPVREVHEVRGRPISSQIYKNGVLEEMPRPRTSRTSRTKSVLWRPAGRKTNGGGWALIGVEAESLAAAAAEIASKLGYAVDVKELSA
jgi:hypothetical protein